jgi:hypothetical protein
MKKWIKDLFDDSNSINEKSVIGFIAFFALLIVLFVDLISKYLGNAVVLTEFIFDGFILIVFGAFGIASIDKWLNKRKTNNTETEKDNTPKPNE